MKRAALLIVPAFAFLAAHAFASEPAIEQKPAAAPAAKTEPSSTKAAAAAKCEKTSPALDYLFDSGKIGSPDSGSRHPEVHLSGSAGISVFVVRR
jgi:membrane protein involved in colicin uptake